MAHFAIRQPNPTIARFTPPNGSSSAGVDDGANTQTTSNRALAESSPRQSAHSARSSASSQSSAVPSGAPRSAAEFERSSAAKRSFSMPKSTSRNCDRSTPIDAQAAYSSRGGRGARRCGGLPRTRAPWLHWAALHRIGSVSDVERRYCADGFPDCPLQHYRMRLPHRSSGLRPVCLAMRASMRGPISSPSWNAKM